MAARKNGTPKFYRSIEAADRQDAIDRTTMIAERCGWSDLKVASAAPGYRPNLWDVALSGTWPRRGGTDGSAGEGGAGQVDNEGATGATAVPVQPRGRGSRRRGSVRGGGVRLPALRGGQPGGAGLDDGPGKGGDDMTKALDPMEKSLRAAEAAHAKLNGKRLGDDRDRFYQAVVDAKAAGASMKEIGERVGISGARVHQIVRDYG